MKRWRHWTDEDIATLLEMNRQGKRVKEIAKHLDRSPDAVLGMARRYGISFRGHTDPDLVIQYKKPRGVLLPCMLPESEWPICREKRCYARHRCPAFGRALTEGKVDDVPPPDTHAAGRKRY